jgi:Flp pilus assembly protein TadG
MTFLRKRRDQRGAALVEFAIIGPVLFLLIFGLIDFGLIFNDYLQVRNGVQSAARLGAVAGFGNSTCTPSPDPSSTETHKLMCLTKDRVGLNAANTRTKVVLDAGVYADGNELVVCAMYPVSSRTKLLSPVLNGKVITTRVAMRIEQTSFELKGLTAIPSPQSTPPVGDIASAEETPLSGQTWNFCTL